MPSLLPLNDTLPPTMTTTDPSTTMTTTGPLSNPSRPALPAAFTHTTPTPTLHYQGAEALLYQTFYPLVPSTPSSTPTTATTSSNSSSSHTTPAGPKTLTAALKHRPSKPYRHPLLDAKLTRHRILSEARALVRLRRDGVTQVPAVYALDWEQGWMLFEWVEGETVRAVLNRELVGDGLDRELGREGEGHEVVALMRAVGTLVARVHEKGVIHGDLTTSNLMVRRRVERREEEETPLPEDQQLPQNEQQQRPQQHHNPVNTDTTPDIVLIDFGLSSQSSQDEDRAVDLYVLERAFGSTHPRTEGLWKEVLKAYGEGYRGAKVVVKRLEEVRMRGRKKILIG